MDKSDSWPRRNQSIGFLLFVWGIGATGYCGYLERYTADSSPELLKLSGWLAVLAGLTWFLLGLLQSPIRRR